MPTNSGTGGARVLLLGSEILDTEGVESVAPPSPTSVTAVPSSSIEIEYISGAHGTYVPQYTYIGAVTDITVEIVDPTLFERVALVYQTPRRVWVPIATRPLEYRLRRRIWVPFFTVRESELTQEWAVGSEFSLYSLDQQWSVAERPVYERSLDQAWSSAVSISEWSLDGHYATVGSQVLSEFLVLLNNLRLSLGLAPVSIYAGASVDIAHTHALTMRTTDVFAHESTMYPVGWRTTEERVGRLRESTSEFVENLALAQVEQFVPISASTWFTSWRDSPPHYLNMVEDFGANPDIRMFLGVEPFADFSEYPNPEGYYTQVATLNLVDFSIKENLVDTQRTLGMQWATYGAYIETLGMSWSTYAYRHVAARHGSTYALRVTSSLSTPYGVFAAAQHSVPLYYTVSKHHATAYAATLPAAARHYGTYDVEEYARVRASHTEEWRIRVAATSDTTYAGSLVPRVWHATEYHDAPRVRNDLYTAYDSLPRVRRYHDSTYAPAYVARASHIGLYSLLPRALASHRALYDDQIPVSAGLDTRYDLSLRNPVVAQNLTFYAIISEAATVFSQQCLVYVRGLEIDCNSFSVRMDEGDASWSMDIDIADVAQYANIRREDTVTVVYCGETFVGFVDSKSIARDDPADVTMSITCRSPVARYDAPYAELVNYTVTAPTEARAVVEELLGSAVDWRIVNWLIPPYRFAATQQSPLAIAKMLVEVAGGVIESNPDGSLYVRYWYPVSVPAFSTTTPGLVLTDIEDNVSQRDRRYKAEVFNSFRVREDNSLMSDRIEWVPDDNDGLNGTLRVYLEPWRTTAELRHTDDIAYPLLPLGVRAREEEDVVEFLDGEGKLQNPATAIVSYRWESEPLGEISLDLRTSTVRAADTSVNYGYGVATVKYVVETLDYRAQIPADSPIQYIVVDKGE